MKIGKIQGIEKEIGTQIHLFRNIESYKDEIALAIRFHLSEVENARKFIELLGKTCVYQKIEKAESRQEALEHAKTLLNRNNYLYYHDEKNGIPFDDLPKKDRESGYFNQWSDASCKWSRYTAEEVIRRNGWWEDEVYWFHITKDNTYCYQLILKEGDWITFAPFLHRDDGHYFQSCVDLGEGRAPLPYCSEWEELKIT